MSLRSRLSTVLAYSRASSHKACASPLQSAPYQLRQTSCGSELAHEGGGSNALFSRAAFHQLIDRYISEIAPKHKGTYSEIKRLEALKRHPLVTRIVATLTSSYLARYFDERLKICKGSTVKRELALFQCVIEVARRDWGIHLAENPVRMVSRPS
ncbi:shufflon-specific recombinase [Pseudomonas syringae pv. actinidiae ICMP 18807]|uniref:Shufflon-specific recombinase n=1 Tax=Pseudomonas syringae pv. actinidiae ICMP 18807 TaxID=1194404 RepID=S6W9H5_PSESF|nr:shufflon-specific recombinase [Pseudomonas syringae pv. actinidiae ICMP 18807]